MPDALQKLWLILRYRPIVKCPLCRGSGGESDCWGEWMECKCWDHWAHLDNWGMEWFIGRVPLLKWPWFWLFNRNGHRSFTGWLLCSLGRHDFCLAFGDICQRCYAVREEKP